AADGVQSRDVATGELRATIPGSARVSHTRRLAFSPDGRRLLQWEETSSGVASIKMVRVYDAPSGRLVFETVANNLADIAWTAEGELLFVRRSSLDQLSAEITDATTGVVRSQESLTVPGKVLGGVAVSGDGRA